MNPRFNLWLMQLPVWRWFARAAAERMPEAEAEQYRDAKARAEYGAFGAFRPSDAGPAGRRNEAPSN